MHDSLFKEGRIILIREKEKALVEKQKSAFHVERGKKWVFCFGCFFFVINSDNGEIWLHIHRWILSIWIIWVYLFSGMFSRTQKWKGASLRLCGASNLKVISVVQAIFKNLCIFWEKSSIICTTTQYFFCHSFTLNLSAKHMIFHLVLQDCLFGRDCQRFFFYPLRMSAGSAFCQTLW